ncbi:MAG: Crp/Fnr family transcriptional regulator [Sphingomonadaceae bacterium]|nr:Crp/Fnr family transcriptional regulator [Sphingomonadaceae bacterium]
MATESAEATAEDQEPFPADLRDAFLAQARPIRVPGQTDVIDAGSDTTEVYLIRSGTVQISVYSLNGREVILREMGPGMIFGELAAIDRLPRSANVRTLEDCQFSVMRADRFLEFLGTVPQAGLWMSKLLAGRIRNLTERTLELATLTVVARIRGELLRRALETGVADDRAVIRVGRRQADFAARIGTHREAVSRELNALKKRSVLRHSGSNVEILSVGKLQSLHESVCG